MFQVTGRSRRLSVRRFPLVVLLVLGIVTLKLSPLCGAAGDNPSQPPTHDADSAKEPKPERPPFDLTYVPPDATGVIAIRPNAIFSDPAMKPLAHMANQAITGFLPIKFPSDLKLTIEEIEELIGFISITPNKGAPKGIHTFGASPLLIRTAHDYDWLKLMRHLDPKIDTIRRGVQIYYKITLNPTSGNHQPMIVYCVIPDKRTLVLLPPAVCFALFTGKPASTGKVDQRSIFSWDQDWKRIEHGLIAVAMDNRWARGLSKEQIGGEPGWASLTENATTMVAGMDWEDGIDFQAYLVGKDHAASSQIVKEIKDVITETKRSLDILLLWDFPRVQVRCLKNFGKMRASGK